MTICSTLYVDRKIVRVRPALGDANSTFLLEIKTLRESYLTH